MKTIHKIMCFLGLHKYVSIIEYYELHINKAFINYNAPESKTKICKHCVKVKR